MAKKYRSNKKYKNNKNNPYYLRSLKKRQRLKKRKIAIFTIFVVFVFVLFKSFGMYKLYKNGGVLLNKNKQLEVVNIFIDKGSSLKNIANVLHENGIIKNKTFFVLKTKKLNKETDFKYGNFELNNFMDYYEIVDILQNSSNNQAKVKFLIKEGQTQKEIAKNLEDASLVSYDEFINACNNETYDFDFLKNLPDREFKLEGYLYPDTYYFDKNYDAKQIVTKILTRFDEVFNESLKQKAKSLNLSVDDVITIASIIEKEVKIEKERNIVAAVIYNRLKNNIKLQMDSTVLYAIKQNKDRVLNEDTKVVSPYNTYVNYGLPIGPISNPGLFCIEAVLNPADVDYIYYVVKDDLTGEHFFTNNYDEFLDAKAKYVSKFE